MPVINTTIIYSNFISLILFIVSTGLLPRKSFGQSLIFNSTLPHPNLGYAYLPQLPKDFGTGEFTLTLYIKPDTLYKITDGFLHHSIDRSQPTFKNKPEELLYWTQADIAPYSHRHWWFEGNFLLDGHNNKHFSHGTFSLQFYGGGRLRWLIGDSTLPEGHLVSVGAYPASTTGSLLDGKWHKVETTRRLNPKKNRYTYELWIDDKCIATTTTTSTVNFFDNYWSNWAEFPQSGWYLGAEKQSVHGYSWIQQFPNYKGLLNSILFYNTARPLKPKAYQKWKHTFIEKFTFNNPDTIFYGSVKSDHTIIIKNMSVQLSDDKP